MSRSFRTLCAMGAASVALAGCMGVGTGGGSAPVSPEIAALNGTWDLAFASDVEFATGGARCSDGTGSVRVTNGEVRGRSLFEGVTLVATGRIAPDGAVAARFTTNQVQMGEATGQAAGDSMSGRFSDDFGCTGTWTATRA